MFAAIFFLVGPLIILYADGWRLNLNELKFEKVGGILLKIKDSDVTVKINGEMKKTDSKFLSGSLTFANLLPKIYEIEVIKNGFQIWKKMLSVKPALIAKSRPIVLIPESLQTVHLRSGVKDFSFQDGLIVWQDAQDHFFLTNPANTESALNLTLLFNHLKNRQLKLSGFAPVISMTQKDANTFFIKTARAWYLLDIKKMSLAKTNQPSAVQEAVLISPDESKVATTTEAGIFITGSEEKFTVSLPDPLKIKNISWFGDSEHLFVQYPASLHFVETDPWPPVNMPLLAKNLKKYAYDPDENRIYLLLNNGGLGYWNFD